MKKMLSSFTSGKRKWLLIGLLVMVVLTLVVLLLPGPKNSSNTSQRAQSSSTPKSGSTSSSANGTPTASATMQLQLTTIALPSPTVAATPAGQQTFEASAKANKLTGKAIVTQCTGCSNGERVALIRGGSTLQFNDIIEAKAGIYTLTIYYVDASPNRNAYMTVNNGSKVLINNFNSTNDNNWNKTQNLQEVIRLNAGSNTILLTNGTYNDCPDIDSITVQPQ